MITAPTLTTITEEHGVYYISQDFQRPASHAESGHQSFALGASASSTSFTATFEQP